LFRSLSWTNEKGEDQVIWPEVSFSHHSSK
jgi:hypothetical protein